MAPGKASSPRRRRRRRRAGRGRHLVLARAGAGDLDVGDLHRARVRQRPADDLLPGPARVGERRAAHGRGRGGVLGGAEVAPHARAGGAAEARLRREQRLRRGELAAAPDAEDRADDERGGDRVGPLPVVRSLRPPDRRVLGRHLRRVQPRLGDVAVDPGDVVAEVAAQHRGLGLEPRADLVDLLLQVGLRVRRHRPDEVVEGAVGRRAAGERRELRAADVAEDVEEEQPVLGGGVAGAEHRAGPRRPVDVRDAAAVAHDRHVVARAVRALGVAGLHAERRVLEEVADLLGGQPLVSAEQVAVHAELVVVVRRARAGGEEGGELGEVRQAVLAGRQDVAKAAGVVLAVGERSGRGQRGWRRDQRDGERDDRRDPPHGRG